MIGMIKSDNKRKTLRTAHRGLVVGNAVISSAISERLRFYGIQFNPSSFLAEENELKAAGDINFSFVIDDMRFNEGWDIQSNTYPKFEACAEFGAGLRARVRAFAPVTPFDSHELFLPAVIVRFVFRNCSNRNVDFSVAMHWTGAESCLERFFFSSDGRCVKGDSFSEHIRLDAGEKRPVDFGFGIYDFNNEWRNTFPDCDSLCLYLSENAAELERGTDEYVSLIPDLGDETLRDYTAWYSQPAVLLTKSAKDGNVITMGYHELNTRDSFWTTFLHLLIFPELERRMIEITAAHQRTDGKIPTTLLPLIEREYDLDINEYFCLRIARYYRYHRDTEFLRSYFAQYVKSVEFLLSRDYDGDGLPEQEPPTNSECYWGDWKDVPYIGGRKLSPHVCLLWLAVLKDGAFLAQEIGEGDTAEHFTKLYEKAYAKVNADFTGGSDGGLWCKDHYNEVWYDGVKRIHILEDMCVGIFFDVVPEERAELMYQALKKNECKFGVREIYPYRTEEEAGERVDAAGTYHNGGVWPWLNFMDIAGRYRYGRADECEKIFHALGYHDLTVSDDYRPNEYLNGQTGENMGFEIQGWSAAVIAAVYFGAFDIVWKDGSPIVKCNLPKDKVFSTKLVLPRCKVIEYVCDGTGDNDSPVLSQSRR